MWSTTHNQRIQEVQNVNYTTQPKNQGATECELHHTTKESRSYRMWTIPHNQRIQEVQNVNYTTQPKNSGATECELH